MGESWRAVFVRAGEREGGEFGPETEGWCVVKSADPVTVLRLEGAVWEDDLAQRMTARALAAVLNGYLPPPALG